MGFLLSFQRKMYLTNYLNSIQSRINELTSYQMSIAEEISRTTSSINRIGDNDSPDVKQLEAQKEELEAIDKKCSMELQKLQSQYQAAQTELQSADQLLQQTIQDSFSYKLAG